MGGPLQDPKRCRTDGFADLDGDGATDCWRATFLRVWLWPGCQGDPLEILYPPEPFSTITLPPAQRTPAWTRAVAEALVGTSRVGCEATTPGCAAPAVGLRWWLARYDEPEVIDELHQTTPIWVDGEPPPFPEPAVVLLDPGATRGAFRNRQDEVEAIPADASIAIYFPAAADIEDPDPERRLAKDAACERWQIMTGLNTTIVIDRAEPRWSYLDAALQRGTRCAAELVFLGVGGHHPLVEVLDPISGRWSSYGVSASWPEELDEGSIWTHFYGATSVAQFHALLEVPPGHLPCEAPAGATPPLLTYAPPAPCTLAGRAKIDARRGEDCWKAEYSGTPVGPLLWTVEIEPGCRGDPNHRLSFPLNTTASMTFELVEELDSSTRQWLAKLLAGSPTIPCVPRRRGCPAPDPAITWMHAKMETFGGDRVTPPTWQDGTPTLPAPGLTEARGLQVFEIEGYIALLVNTLGDGLAPSGSLTVQPATCGRWHVWSGPLGGAVVDPETNRWAWAYLSSPGWANRPDSTARVGKGWCEADLAFFELDSGELVISDPARGAWSVLTVKERTFVKNRADRLDLLRKRLATVGDDHRPFPLE